MYQLRTAYRSTTLTSVPEHGPTLDFYHDFAAGVFLSDAKSFWPETLLLLYSLIIWASVIISYCLWSN